MSYTRFGPSGVLADGPWQALHHTSAQEQMLRALAELVATEPLARLDKEQLRNAMTLLREEGFIHVSLHPETLFGPAYLELASEDVTCKVVVYSTERLRAVRGAGVDLSFGFEAHRLPPVVLEWDNTWTDMWLTNLPLAATYQGFHKQESDSGDLTTPLMVLTFPGGFAAVALGRQRSSL